MKWNNEGKKNKNAKWNREGCIVYAQVGLCFMFTVLRYIYMYKTDLNFYLFCPHFQIVWPLWADACAHAQTHTQLTESTTHANKEQRVYPILCQKHIACICVWEHFRMHMHGVNCNFYLCSVKKFNAFFFSCALIRTHNTMALKLEKQERNVLSRVETGLSGWGRKCEC